MIRILGISAFYHDSAAALDRKWKNCFIAFKRKELSRKKNDHHFPLSIKKF